MTTLSPSFALVDSFFPWRTVLVLCSFVQILQAATVDDHQLKPINYERFQELDDLDFSVVTCFEQDSFGFMWIGTKDGLICFDGYESKHYSAQIQESQSLTDNSITSILEAHVPGDLWVLTENGMLHYLTRETERFFLFRPKADPQLEWQVNQEVALDRIAKGPDGNIWALSADGMIYRLEVESKTFHRLSSQMFTGTSHLLDEPKHTAEIIWEPGFPNRLMVFTHETGVLILDLAQQHVTHKILPLAKNTEVSGRIYSVASDDTGVMWLSVDDQGILRWDPELDQLEPVPLLNDSLLGEEGILDGDLSFCSIDHDGFLWMAYHSLYNALTRYNPLTQTFDHFFVAGNNIQDFTKPTCSFIDRQGMLWVGGNRGDVYLVHPPQAGVIDWRDPFKESLPSAFGVSAVIEDKHGDYWLGTSMNGLYRIQTSNNEISNWSVAQDLLGGLKTDAIDSLLEDTDGSIWIGTDGAGLHRFDTVTDTWQWFDSDTSAPTLKSGRRVRAMLRDSFQQFWIGTKDGLKLFHTETGSMVVYVNDPKDPGSLSNSSVRNLYEDSKGVLWIATDHGLNRYNRDSNDFTRYVPDPNDPGKISSGLVRCMLEDSSGRFWVGTRNGLNLMDREQGSFELLNLDSSAFSNVFLSLLEDESGHLWGGTGQGLFRLDALTGSKHSFGKDDGLINSQYESGAAIIDRDGNILLGGKSGMDMIHPDGFTEELDSQVTPATLTKMVVSGKSYSFGELNGWRDVPELKVFGWKQNDVEFYFSSLHFRDIKRARYRWRLVGLNDQWEDPVGKTSLRYANLPPGDYQFEVVASDYLGEIKSVPPAVRFTIKAPFWATGKFQVMVACSFGLMVLGGYGLRVRRANANRRLLEQRIQERTRELNLSDRALNAASNGIVISESDSLSIIHVNRTFCEMFGFQKREILGKDIDVIFGPDREQADTMALINDVRSSSESRVTMCINHKSGSSFWCEIQLAKVMDDKGEPTHLIWTLIDVTSEHEHEASLREARDEAEAANKAKSDFLSRMSHELRTPLNSIIGFSKLLKMAPMSQRESNNIERIHRAGKHLLNLINDVLDIERTESEQLQFSPNGVLVVKLLREGIEMLTPLASEFQVAVVLDLNFPTELRVVADRRRLQQVFLNFISNGIKYNLVGGTLHIRCERVEEDRVIIHFRDEGNGIPKEKMTRLFIPFDRLGAEQRSHVEGTGLGLALSKKLLEAMGGSIQVESEPGVGSTFSVGLRPVALKKTNVDEEEETAFFEKKSFEKPQKTTILYIEDNADNLNLVEQVLELRPSLQLLSTSQGKQGFSMAEEYTPDLILLDLNLPDLNGDELVMMLKKKASTQNIPICILSADAQPAQINRLKSMGVVDYLVKPLDIPQFLKTIDKLVGKNRASNDQSSFS